MYSRNHITQATTIHPSYTRDKDDYQLCGKPHSQLTQTVYNCNHITQGLIILPSYNTDQNDYQRCVKPHSQLIQIVYNCKPVTQGLIILPSYNTDKDDYQLCGTPHSQLIQIVYIGNHITQGTTILPSYTTKMTINCEAQPIPSCIILNAKFLLSHLTKHFSIITELKDGHQHESKNNSIFLSLQMCLHPHITLLYTLF